MVSRYGPVVGRCNPMVDWCGPVVDLCGPVADRCGLVLSPCGLVPKRSAGKQKGRFGSPFIFDTFCGPSLTSVPLPLSTSRELFQWITGCVGESLTLNH